MKTIHAMVLTALAISGCGSRVAVKPEAKLVPVRIDSIGLSSEDVRRLTETKVIPIAVDVDKHVIVFPGDTLWSIAQIELGDSRLWPILCWANRLEDCAVIEPGQVLHYPMNITQENREQALKFSDNFGKPRKRSPHRRNSR